MPSLNFLRIEGSPFDAGVALGRFGAAVVHERLLASAAWTHLMQWRGSARLAAMAALVRQRFPRIQQELEGLAHGLGLPFEDTLIWNCRGDLWAMSPDGCTTVQLPDSMVPRISHNEDGDPIFAGHCAIAEVAVAGSPRFASFVYPGSLPGHTIAVTDVGLAVTVNNLRLQHVEDGVPRMVLARALLDASNLEQAAGLLQETPKAGGFHLTLAQRGRPEILSVEFGAGACSVQRVEAPSLHSNHAIHPGMRDLPQIITGSSGHRQQRGDALLADAQRKHREVQPLVVLGDRANAKFPIHRDDPTDGDEENTLATADIRVGQSRIDWQVYEHPLGPVRFQMTDGHQSPTSQPTSEDA
ncbi:MAG: peptidase C45 [Proteobacteria bacterium]|nr:peptidase C45 [Pseudomonadota bacterium]